MSVGKIPEAASVTALCKVPQSFPHPPPPSSVLLLSQPHLSCRGFDHCTFALPLGVQVNIGTILLLVIRINIQKLERDKAQINRPCSAH